MKSVEPASSTLEKCVCVCVCARARKMLEPDTKRKCMDFKLVHKLQVYCIPFWNKNQKHYEFTSPTTTLQCLAVDKIYGYADCLLASSQHNLYDIYLLLCVQC
jgi:hypothetical protein